MNSLQQTAPAFVEMAHSIVWCSAATVDAAGRPRSRVLHPYWEWDGVSLVGWVATGPTPIKRAHLLASPFMSCNYWTPSQDTCVAEVATTWHLDIETRERVWRTYTELPAPLGYDPSIIPTWDGPESRSFAVLRLDPWLLRVFPGSVLLGGAGDVLLWRKNG